VRDTDRRVETGGDRLEADGELRLGSTPRRHGSCQDDEERQRRPSLEIGGAHATIIPGPVVTRPVPAALMRRAFEIDVLACPAVRTACGSSPPSTFPALTEISLAMSSASVRPGRRQVLWATVPGADTGAWSPPALKSGSAAFDVA
jgi:hypothetical protein